MQKIPLPTGIDDFKKLRSNNNYYIDKTILIEQVVETHSIKIERNNLLCEQAPTEVFRSIFAWLVARLTFYLQLCGPLGQIPYLGGQAIVEFRLMADHENTSLVFFQCPFQLVFGIHIQMVRWLVQ